MINTEPARLMTHQAAKPRRSSKNNLNTVNSLIIYSYIAIKNCAIFIGDKK